MTVSNSQCSNTRRLLPSRTCAICQKSLEEIGGRRLVASNRLRFGVQMRHAQVGESNAVAYERLLDDNEFYFVASGEDSFPNCEAMERRVAEYRRHFRPWVCQVCGGSTCRACGGVLRMPMGRDILNSDGSSAHCPILPIGNLCPNDCKDQEIPEFRLSK